MNNNQFDDCVRKIITEHHAWFKGVEPAAFEVDVAILEAKLGNALPEQFKHFALTFGGGYFGKTNISTLHEDSVWYVLSRPRIEVEGRDMLVISDDEAGGYYGFLLEDGGFGTGVTYAAPEDGAFSEVVASSFFVFIEKFAIDF